MRVVEIEEAPPPPEFNPLGGVAVIARNTWAAIKGREALKIEWDDGPNRTTTRRSSRPARGGGPKARQVVRNDGDFDAGIAGAADG